MIDLQKPTDEVIKAIKKACVENRADFTKEWVKNYRRLAGFTEEDIYPVERSVNSGVVLIDPKDTRYVTSFNRTRGFFMRLLGRMMPAITHYQVLAASTDDEDKDAARSAAEMLETRTSVDSGRDFEEVCRAISYLFAGGPVYLRIEPNGPNEEQREVDVAAVLPFDVFYYPGVHKLADSPAIVLVERLTQQEIERRFPELADHVLSNVNSESGETGWGTLPEAKWPKEVNWGSIARRAGAGFFTVERLIIKPCKDYPDGQERATIKGMDKEATTDGINTADKEYPVVTLQDVPMGPFYEDRGRMSISARMQQIYDICVSKMTDIMVKLPQACLNLPLGGGLNPDKIHNKAVLITQTHNQMRPTIDSISTMGSLPDMAAFVSQAMDEVHSQHGPSRGKIPGTRTSGKALEEMVTRDIAGDEPLMAMLRRSMGRVGKRILMEGQRVWDPSYTFHVLGRNRRYQAKAFESANLKDGFSVRVLPDDGLPKNKVARMKMVSDWQKQGLLNDSIEARRARDMIGMAVDDDMYVSQPAEEMLIRNEEEQISAGQQTPVNFSDDHILHRIRHKARNTERLANGQTSPEILEAANDHDMMHIQKMQEEMQLMAPPMPPEGVPQ
jgi:hypothetical protein